VQSTQSGVFLRVLFLRDAHRTMRLEDGCMSVNLPFDTRARMRNYRPIRDLEQIEV
jgi:hypothetical protein